MLHVSRIKSTLLAGLVSALGVFNVQAADLTVGANIGNVPWEFEDANGKVTGFEVDLVNEIAKRLGKTVEFVNTPFNGLFPAVQSGRINMAISSITITEKRLASVTFAQPYYDSDQSLTVTAASGITGLKGMSGKVVGVDTGSTGDMWAEAHKAEYKLGEIQVRRLAASHARSRCWSRRWLYLRHSGPAVLRQGQAGAKGGRAYSDG